MENLFWTYDVGPQTQGVQRRLEMKDLRDPKPEYVCGCVCVCVCVKERKSKRERGGRRESGSEREREGDREACTPSHRQSTRPVFAV